jgi:hypothetical protein
MGQKIQNIFSDRSSLALRAFLREPEGEWTLGRLVEEGVSLGVSSEVLNRAEKLGYIERVRKGPQSYSRLIRKDVLLKDWLNAYQFERNQKTYYFYPKEDFLKTCVSVLRKKKVSYALTLFSASRLISPYVKDGRHFLYVDVNLKDAPSFFKELESEIGLYKLVKGGNVCFAVPYYSSSVFRDSQKIKGCSAVSNLQLYLDLMTFPPAGPEEANQLILHFKKKGISFV